MRKFLCLIMTIFLLTAVSAPVFAEDFVSEEPPVRKPGFCGENIRWSYEDGVLTLEGSGRMDDFYAGQPWQKHAAELKEVKLKGSITYIGAYAFSDYDALQKVDFGTALTEIGQSAFSGCDGLTEVSLPMSFRIFGEESFSHCKNLKEFHFEGGFPKFKLNSMWDTYAKLYYPAERPWPLEHIQQLEEAFQGRIEFLASDGTDPYDPQEETQAPATEETAPPTTEAVTEAATAPAETSAPTEAPTVPETMAPTQAPTQTPTEAPTEKPTAPAGPVITEPQEDAYVELPQEEANSGMSLPMVGLIALMVLSGGGALYMLGRISGNRKKEFDGNFSEILLEDERKKPKKPTVAQKKAGSAAHKKGGRYQSKK